MPFNLPTPPSPPDKLTNLFQPPANDRNEYYDLATPPLTFPYVPVTSSSVAELQSYHIRSPSVLSSGSTRTLRRTPQFNFKKPDNSLRSSPPQPTHVEAVTVGLAVPASTATSVPREPQRVRFAQPDLTKPTTERKQSDDSNETNNDNNATTTSDSSEISNRELGPVKYRAKPVYRINRHIAAAILYTLEEALRHPYSFTPDLEEENASMADMQMPVGGQPVPYGGGSNRANNGAANNGVPRPGIPQPTGSPSIKGPKQIMIDRVAREEKKKAEKERERLAREEQERQILEQRRISDERKAQGLGGGGGQNYNLSGDGQRISGSTNRTSGGRVVSGGQSQAAATPVTTGATGAGLAPSTSHAAQQKRAQRAAAAAGSSGAVKPTGEEQMKSMKHDSGLPEESPFLRQGEQGKSRTNTSSFPHAFERWESLSSHWEGLTSYWIRKLEENARLLETDPINMHLARQVTDLTAAGANLFHAVVELQRLRASSERKFQRWFFDTRNDNEAQKEMLGQLQKLANEERAGRVSEREIRIKLDAELKMVKAEIEELKRNGPPAESRESAQAKDKVIAELKRELEISKSEARRAWEELGRREQEERDRTAALREGMPTLIGGVQVVPMLPGVPPSRHVSTSQRERPATRDGTYPGGPTSGMMGGMEEDGYQAQTGRARQESHDDPFVTSQPPATSSATKPARPSTAPSSQPATTSAGYYQQPYATASGNNDNDSGDEYEIDSQGNFLLDASGRRIPYRSRTPSAVDEDDYVAHPGVTYTRGTSSGVTSAATASQNLTAQAPDYSGQAYGWEDLGRHQHPTRLSDVIEEDERSRTSASLVSRRE